MTGPVRTGLICAALAAALPVSAQPTMGVGVLCSYALVVGLRSFQQGCHPALAEQAGFLDPLIAKHRGYVARNGAWSEARIQNFEADQSAATADCARDDLEQMMTVILAEPERLTKTLEFQLSQGRKPEWGVCF